MDSSGRGGGGRTSGSSPPRRWSIEGTGDKTGLGDRVTTRETGTGTGAGTGTVADTVIGAGLALGGIATVRALVRWGLGLAK